MGQSKFTRAKANFTRARPGLARDCFREVEGVRYIEMHRGPHTYWAPPPSRGGDLELEGGVDVSL